jgi:general transcription factor 3C polypeptide 5 (transcription factor C subunit 1)
MDGPSRSAPESGSTVGPKKAPPTFTIPPESIVCVEHPCIIKNLDKGIRSMGGEVTINKVYISSTSCHDPTSNEPQFLETNDKAKSLPTSLRPDDVLAKAMPSRQVEVNQILLEVTVPKWTGRKRKRGSSGPFLSEAELQDGTSKGTSSIVSTPKAATILRALRDNPSNYTVAAVGHIKESHRFRSIPDYQYAHSTNTLMTRMREKLMTDDLEKIKEFRLDGVVGLPKTQDVGPPPFFSIIQQPYNYSFRQNAYVKLVTDETGAVTTVNITAPAKHVKHYLDPDDPNVPLAPPAELAPEESLEPRMQDWIAKLRAELQKRPLMQRRVYGNMFKGQNDLELKRASGYCGYTFASGPFKDVLIKFGVDPRSDPKYRIYQAVGFQIAPDGQSAPDDPGSYMKQRRGKREFFGSRKWVPNTHIFDGNKFYRDGKIWQVCDITDPFLKNLLETAQLREKCDMTFSGWYGNGTWSVFRIAMKDKIRILGEGKVPNDHRYETIAKMFPWIVDESNLAETQPDSSGMLNRSNQIGYPVDTQTAVLASNVRAMAMAAHRHRHRHQRGRRPRAGSMAMSDGNASSTGEMDVDVPETAEMEEEDEALIGMDSGSEDDQDGEDSDEQEQVEDE